MDFPIENGDFSIVMLHVSLPEGKPPFSYGFPMGFPIQTTNHLWFSYGF